RLFSVRAGMERTAPDHADWPADLLRYVSIGPHRNPTQDVAFGIQQLVDIALKALSPAVNDTTTAIMAIDYLGELVGQLARREFPDVLRSDGQHLRVLVRVYDFTAYVRLAFDLVRENARDNPAVLRRVLRAMALVASQVHTPDRLAVLREQATLVLACAQATLGAGFVAADLRHLSLVSAHRARQSVSDGAGRLFGAQKAVSANFLLPRGRGLLGIVLLFGRQPDALH
nr:hypothetical protein [Tanacetum cinerariifolium]